MMEEENDAENIFGMAILFYFFNQEFSGSLVVSKNHLKIK
jgi:hypothetical protein